MVNLDFQNCFILLVSSASMANEIFRTQDVNVSSRGIPITEGALFFGPETIAGAPFGIYSKFIRKLMVMKLFGTQALEQSRGIRENELEWFYSNLLDKAMKKERIDFLNEIWKHSYNSVCKMLMGRSFSEEKGEAERARDSVNKTNSTLWKTVVEYKLVKMLGISLFGKKIRHVFSGFDELLEKNLQEHEETPEEHQVPDMMDVLLAASRDENAEYKITRNQIKPLLVELFYAGTETSTQTMQWAMAEIIKPSILERLRQEIDSVVGKARLIQETDLPRLPYLQAVVKETLRLHPPFPLVVRRFEKGCKVGGFCIPDKTRLVVNAYAVMRDPNFWEDPDEFKPERFLALQEREQALKYLPFGSGRRGCPAVNLAYTFVGTVVGMMVHCFDWKTKGDKVVNMKENFVGIVLTMAHPLNCTHRPRSDSLTLNLQIPSL